MNCRLPSQYGHTRRKRVWIAALASTVRMSIGLLAVLLLVGLLSSFALVGWLLPQWFIITVIGYAYFHEQASKKAAQAGEAASARMAVALARIDYFHECEGAAIALDVINRKIAWLPHALREVQQPQVFPIRQIRHVLAVSPQCVLASRNSSQLLPIAASAKPGWDAVIETIAENGLYVDLGDRAQTRLYLPMTKNAAEAWLALIGACGNGTLETPGEPTFYPFAQ